MALSRKTAILIPTLNIGGSERVASLLANEFARRPGLESHVVMYGNFSGCSYKLSDSVVLHYPYFEFDNRFRTLSTLRRLLFLRKILKDGEYDGVLSFGNLWNNFAMVAGIGLRKSIYLSDRSSPERKIGRLQSLLCRLLYPKASGLLAQTAKARDVAVKRGLNRRVRVVPNPVVIPRASPESARQNLILSVGRMVATKNHDQLIKIFASLGAQADDWRLVIVGDDDQQQKHRSKLEELARRYGVFDRVVFAGEQTDVQPYYDQAKVFAFTSSSEGFPNAIAEALASGLPVISYDCVAGPSDLITNGENGYLVDVFDKESFRDRLTDLITDEQKRFRMSTRARESVAKFSVEHVASDILEFMEVVESP